jgi:hypothetical protein
MIHQYIGTYSNKRNFRDNHNIDPPTPVRDRLAYGLFMYMTNDFCVAKHLPISYNTD